MSNTKPQITATIKFRDVTIENMTLDELRALRDELNKIVGGKEYVPYPQPVYPAQPWEWRPYWVTVSGNTVATDKIVLDGNNNTFGVYSTAEHFTISCAN